MTVRRTRRVLGTVVATTLLAVGVAGASAAGASAAGASAADAGPSGTPSPTGSAAGSPSEPPSPDPELVRAAEDALQEQRAKVAGTQITDAMRAAAVIDLRAVGSTLDLQAADPTFDLRPDDSTTVLEKTVEKADDTVVTLTSDLLFAFGSSELTPEAEAAVADLAAGIAQDARVQVDGHTDAVGADAGNQELSEDRAQAVADVLADARPDLDLSVTGHGEEDPVAENEVGGEDNPAGRALNRRVEVTYPTS